MTQELEERIAHLERTCDDLSAEIARQAADITRLLTQTQRLAARAAEQDAQGTGGIILGDERPPHY